MHPNVHLTLVSALPRLCLRAKCTVDSDYARQALVRVPRLTIAVKKRLLLTLHAALLSLSSKRSEEKMKDTFALADVLDPVIYKHFTETLGFTDFTPVQVRHARLIYAYLLRCKM